MINQSVLDTIGNTPLIELQKVTATVSATVLAKVEAYNPGQSAKDRIAKYMVEKAERLGKLKPGATLVEATSGNTGFGLAMVARAKGYKCVLTVSSKSSQEKINLLRAMGARVVVCPKEAKPEDPRSYYSQAIRLSKEIEGAYYINQNFNLDNSEAHYATTGPEIWKQTKGQITHLAVCVGTGGTISGTARYLKEQNPNIKIIGVDAVGSVLKKYWETNIFDENEIQSYRVEGLGKTIIPANVNFDLIDHFEKVNDKDSAFTARAMARDEALFLGYSSGSAVQAVLQMEHHFKPTDVVVAICSDHGSRYLGKIYNDEWMHQQGFMDDESVHHQTEKRPMANVEMPLAK